MTVATETQYDRLMQWHRGETPGPWQISFYPTYRCNIRCKICWKQAFEEPIDRQQELKAERMLTLVDEAAELGVREWIVGGGGELMLRPSAVMPMLERIRHHGMNGLVQTNFTRFTDQQLERLVELQWKNIHISLDGPTAEINDAIRDKNDFDRVNQTIAKIQEIKRAHGSLYPILNINSVVTTLNCEHLRGFIDLSARHGISPGGLALIDLIIYGEHDKHFALTEDQRRRLPDLVRDAIAYAEELGVTCFYPNFLAGMKDGRKMDALDLFHAPEETVSNKSMCFEPFTHMVILPDGESGPCCTFYDPGQTQSVWNTPLKEVWLGPYMQETRRRLLQGKPMEYCKDCMQTRIAVNKQTQEFFTHYFETYEEAQAQQPVGLGLLLNKVSTSITRHGVSGAVKRGKEWLEIRTRAKERIRQKQAQ